MQFFKHVGGGLFEVFKTQLEQVSCGDQVFGVFESANGFFVQVQSLFRPDFRPQVAECVFGEHHFAEMDCGLIDGAGVAADVHEPGVGEHFQQCGDSIGVRRRFHDADSLASHGHFFHQCQQGILPDAALGFGHFCGIQKSFIDIHATLERGHQVG